VDGDRATAYPLRFRKPFLRLATIADVRWRVLAGEVDYLSLKPAERWVGGVRIVAGQPAWRFDGAKGRIAPPR
jgi:hypothetical protein